MRTIRSLLTFVVAAAAFVATLAIAGPAQAAPRDGSCESGEFCYYFNSNNQGSVSDFTESVDSYGATQPGCYEFRGPGNGQDQCIKNNAASVWNRASVTVRVFYNSDFTGAYQDIAPGAKVQLNSTLYNQNASHQFLTGGGGSGGSCKSDGSDTKVPSYIFVYRTSLDRVDKVDFKTYVKNVLPNEWVSSWPAESLKAGAEAVKTFAWYYALHSAFESKGRCFDVYDSTKSQVYKPGTAVASTSSAVDATWSTRMSRSGKIFVSHYCSTTTACPAYEKGNWMSQYGSRDQASAGKGYQAILKSYYTGIAFG